MLSKEFQVIVNKVCLDIIFIIKLIKTPAMTGAIMSLYQSILALLSLNKDFRLDVETKKAPEMPAIIAPLIPIKGVNKYMLPILIHVNALYWY